MGWDVEQVRVGTFAPNELVAIFDNPPRTDPAIIEQVRTEILRRRDCPVGLLNRAPKLGSVALDRAAAAHPATSTPVLLACANRRRHWSIRHAVLSRPDLPASLAISIAKAWRDGGPEIRHAAGGSWETIATYPPGDLACLAANPATPASVLDQLAQSRLPMVQVEVARNPSTPTERIIALLGSSDDVIAAAAAANPSIPPETIASWLEIEERPGWMAYRAANNPSCPEDASDLVLSWMAVGGASGNLMFDPDSELGTPTTTGIDLEWTTAHALAHGPWMYSSLPRVRALQWRSKPTVQVLQTTAAALAEDRTPYVRRVALAHKPLNRTTVDVLVDDPDPEIAAAAKRYRAQPGNVAEPRKRRRRVSPRARVASVSISLAIIFGPKVLGALKPWSDNNSGDSTLTALDHGSEAPPEPTKSARVQLYGTRPYLAISADSDSGIVGDLYRTGSTFEAPSGSGLDSTVFWRRSGSELLVLFGLAIPPQVHEDPSAPESFSLIERTITATWTQPGQAPQSKSATFIPIGPVLMKVLIEPNVGGTVTIISTDDTVPFTITCDLAASCSAK